MEDLDKGDTLDKLIKSLLANETNSDDKSSHRFSDETLHKLIELRVEMEKTKQTYYMLENKRRVLDILQLCEKLNLPREEILAYLSSNNIDKIRVTEEKSVFRPNGMNKRTEEERKKTGGHNLPCLSSFNEYNDLNITNTPHKSQGVKSSHPQSENLHSKSNLKKSHNVAALRSGDLSKSPLNKKYPLNAKTNGKHLRTVSVPLIRLQQNSDIPSNMTSILSFPKETNDFQDNFTHTFALEKPLNLTRGRKPSAKPKSRTNSISIDHTLNDYNKSHYTGNKPASYPTNLNFEPSGHNSNPMSPKQLEVDYNNGLLSTVPQQMHNEVNEKDPTQITHRSSLRELLNNT